MKRAIFVVLDGLGVGALPDAVEYGDVGSDTLGNVSRHVKLRLPFLGRLGLGNITPVMGVPPVKEPECTLGRLAPRSVGKDTTVGHWEHMGLPTMVPFPTYPSGFPGEIVDAFARNIGREVLGNRPASGTAIIAELGEEHLATGKPIIYTSADSVFQVAAHVGKVPLELLYSWCKAARELLTEEHAVARVIARPFAGKPGSFMRTKDRRDFALPPPGPTYLDLLVEAGIPVTALGKINEIFAGRGVTTSLKVGSNEENLRCIGDQLAGTAQGVAFSEGLLMTNLVDFDMLWGHRNDVEGFARGLEAADRGLEKIVDMLRPDDLLLITADHGVDPTTASTDHSREYVPVLVYPRCESAGVGVFQGEFADSGATVFEYLTGTRAKLEGRSIPRLRPRFGWSSPTPTQSRRSGALAGLPGRVGREQAEAAARWLRDSLGGPPEMGVVLGSGLFFAYEEPPVTTVSYQAIPHWRVGSVDGHPQTLGLAMFEGRVLAILQGRIHEYEGFDVSEVQLPIHTLGAWGVRKMVFTSASGAVSSDVGVGTVVAAHTVLDFHHLGSAGEPEELPGTNPDLAEALRNTLDAASEFAQGAHASVPGPQYETPAELEVLARAGASTVSMSPASELRAAREAGLEAVVLLVVTNAGTATHAQVLEASEAAREVLTRPLAALASVW